MFDGTTYAQPRNTDTTPGRFAKTPHWVTLRVRNGTALRIYEHLAARYCDTNRVCFPYQTTLADDLGYGLRTVERAMRTLRDASAVITIRSHKLNGHWGRNSYILPVNDPTNASSPPPEVDLSDQQEQGVCAGGNHPPDVAVREPDPLKEPQAFNPEDQNLEHGAIAPSTRGVDGKCDHAEDQEFEVGHDEPASEAPHATPVLVPGGGETNPKTGLDEEHQRPRVGPTLNEEYPWCRDWEDQRMERLLDLVGRRVHWVSMGCSGTGVCDLEVYESAAAQAMLERGEHWRKVVATLMKQFRWEYAA